MYFLVLKAFNLHQFIYTYNVNSNFFFILKYIEHRTYDQSLENININPLMNFFVRFFAFVAKKKKIRKKHVYRSRVDKKSILV